MTPSRFAAVGSVLILLGAPPAFAGGINLAWGTGCWQDNPNSLLTFACDTNVGRASMTASFLFDGASRSISGITLLADLQSDTALLPDWWQLGAAGSCRASSLLTSADFTGAPGACQDPWLGQAVAGFIWVTTAVPGPYRPPSAPNRARLKATADVFPGLVTLAGGVEHYALRFTLDFAKSIGGGACAGCATPVTVVLNDVWGFAEHLTTPLANACLRWQADGVTPCSATPARNSTWGQVKGLYR